MTHSFYHTHTPPTADWLLMQYAAGALPPYESMLMAAWLATSAAARQQLRSFEAEGGRMIDDVEPVSVTHGCLNAVLARIDIQAARPVPPTAAAHDGIPACFVQLVTRHCPQQTFVWRQVTNGAATIDITLCRTEPRHRQLRLLRLGPNQSTPLHSHDGIEITLVLDGSFHDNGRRYAAGDIAIATADPQSRHSPRAEDAGCTCLMLTDAPLRLSNPIARFLALFGRF